MRTMATLLDVVILVLVVALHLLIFGLGNKSKVLQWLQLDLGAH